MPGKTTLSLPLVGSDRTLDEFTLKGLLLGAALSMVLASANAYIGMLVGMTVSASIPAAAVSMGVLRVFRRSNILENNMVQTSASAGESLVAGIIFTVPALVMMGAWDGYHYWPIVVIGLIGGVLGVAFTIPLRRALIVNAELAFPEGMATSEVLKSGGIEYDAEHPEKGERSEEAEIGFRRLMEAAGLGGLFKLLESGLGVLSGHLSATHALMQGKLLVTANVFLSPALLGVGYIVGLNIAVLVFAGGVIGTAIGVPLNWALNSERILEATGIPAGTLFHTLRPDEWVAVADESWQNCRRIGVGAMLVGGFWSLISLAGPLVEGIRSSLRVYKRSRSDETVNLPRTERDMPFQIVALTVLVASVPLFFAFYWALGDYHGRGMIAVVMTVMMLLFGFLFSTVAGYMSGLVGSSNNPISGVTIATVVVTAVLLTQLMGRGGVAATLGPIMVIFLAANVCAAAAIAGDNMQDLKCGHVLGATPWRQQVYQLVGVVSAAFMIPVILNILDRGHGIGRPLREGASFLPAPQAGLMKDISIGIFGAGIAWNFIFLGCLFAIVLIIIDRLLEKREAGFRLPVLAVAIGVYLPLGLSVLIFVGGVLAYVVDRKHRGEREATLRRRESTGLLVASGLITGEALMGVLVAVAAVIFVDRMPSDVALAPWFGTLAILALGVYLYKRASPGNPGADLFEQF